MGYAYHTDQTQMCGPGTKLIRIYTQDAEITLSVRTVNRCRPPRSGCPRISCCRQGFTKKWLAADRPRCQRVCSLVHGYPSQGWCSNQRRMANIARGSHSSLIVNTIPGTDIRAQESIPADNEVCLHSATF